MSTTPSPTPEAPAHLLPTHHWVKLVNAGQGPRDICGECGISRTPITEHTTCAGAHERRGKVISDYDPFN